MNALGPGEIRAESRPQALLLVTLVRALFAAMVASPLSTLVASSGIGQRPEADRALFEDGGYLLLEVLRVRGSELDAAVRGLVPLLALGVLVNIACNAALLTALNARPLRWTELASRACQRTPALAVVGAGALLLQGLLLVVGLSATLSWPEPPYHPVPTTLGQLLALVLLGLAAGALGGLADVAKATLVRHDSSIKASLAHALKCLRRRPWTSALGWLPWAGAFALASFAGGELCALLDVSRPGSWRVWAVFGVHQLVVAFAVFARAAWYARALRLVATTS